MDSDLKAQLEEIAQFEDRSASYLANQAIKNFVDERIATRELLQVGVEMVEQDAPSISSDKIHEWFMADDDAEFPQATSLK